ncbi:MAG: tail fiber domain-containing protein [candidate division Zixibacteria bacterium]|nr:tail fiber domain-containing protein [candidate division Zixibacteria bacterium]
MQRSVSSIAVGLLVIGLLISSATATVPVLIGHSGRLLDSDDAPISGTIDITYAIFETPAGGTALWTETHPNVAVTNGLFSVTLGSIVPLTTDIVAGSGGGGGGAIALERYLEVRIGGDPPISPRTRLAAAPYAVAAGRVDGDIKTGPGIVIVGDTMSNAYATFGEKVQAGLHAAGSALASGAALITSECESGSGNARLAIKTKGTSAHRSVVSSTNQDSATTVVEADLDGDGIAENSVSSSVDGSGANRRVESLSIGSSGEDGVEVTLRCKPDSVIEMSSLSEGLTVMSSYTAKQGSTGRTKRTAAFALDGSRSQDDEVVSIFGGAQRRLEVHNIGSSGQDGISELRCTPDSIVAENSVVVAGEVVTQSYTARQGKTGSASGKRTINPGGGSSETEEVCDTGGVSLKLKIDSTPARISTNITIGKQTQSASFGQRYDSDGDGIPEGEIAQSVTPTTCGVAINQKGTGADKNRVVIQTTSSGLSPGASTALQSDSDGDSVPESEIAQFVTPTTCGVAINQKGTGAAKGRTIGSSCDDSSAVQVIEVDDDGDGIVEGRGIISVKAATGTGSTSASSHLSCDPNEDGTPDSEISQIVTPTTCSVAIKSKGTGADKNRTISSSCDGDEALHVLTADDDNDGLIDRGVTSSVDTATAQVVASGSDIGVAMKVKNKGVVKGNVTVNNANKVMIDFDSDGLGYVDSSLGVGVAPSHRIDVAGGAYCDGTDWVNASDANAKENFKKVNGAELLDQIADLEITKWNYRGDAGSQHIGPTAQDFQKAFGVGSDGKSISTIDPSGIALAAIKELYAQLKQKDQEVEALRQELAKLRRELKK